MRRQLQRGAICALSPTPGSLGRQGELANGRSAECRLPVRCDRACPRRHRQARYQADPARPLVPREVMVEESAKLLVGRRRAIRDERGRHDWPRFRRVPRTPPPPGCRGMPPAHARPRRIHVLAASHDEVGAPCATCRQPSASSVPMSPVLNQSRRPAAGSRGIQPSASVRAPQCTRRPRAPPRRATAARAARPRVEALFVWRGDNLRAGLRATVGEDDGHPALRRLLQQARGRSLAATSTARRKAGGRQAGNCSNSSVSIVGTSDTSVVRHESIHCGSCAASSSARALRCGAPRGSASGSTGRRHGRSASRAASSRPRASQGWPRSPAPTRPVRTRQQGATRLSVVPTCTG